MYTVKFYKGDYAYRQRQANADGAACYVEHHFNSSASQSASYAVAIVGSNASRKSIKWARTYVKKICGLFNVESGGNDGIMVGGYNGRGNANLKHTSMPAILVEPMFGSNPSQAEIIRSPEGQQKLAEALADSIREHFPDGGLVAFSVGHKYKKSNPNDRGAALRGGGTEADYAEIVLIKTSLLLSGSQSLESLT